MRLAIACILLLSLTGCYESSSDSTKSTQSNATTTEQAPTAQNKADKTEPDEAAFLADALEQVQSGTALLVDVRSNEEWDEAHFAIAKHIPVDKIKEDAKAAFAEIKKEQTVFIH